MNLDKNIALEAALAEEDDDENESLLLLVDKEGPLQCVFYQIKFTDLWAHFELTGHVYSAFPDEQEVLLQDGISCRINNISKQKNFEETGQDLTVINLTYPI